MKEGVVVVRLIALAACLALGGVVSAADEPATNWSDDRQPGASTRTRTCGPWDFSRSARRPRVAAATKRFAALLPKLPPDAQAGLLDALATGATTRPGPPCWKCSRAATRRCGRRPSGPGLVGRGGRRAAAGSHWAATAEPEKTAARASLVQLRGQDGQRGHRRRIEEGADRTSAWNCSACWRPAVPSTASRHPGGRRRRRCRVRMAAMAALGQLAGPEHVADMLKGVLKAEPGPEREAAEKAVMFVCNRIEDADKRAEPLLAAWPSWTRRADGPAAHAGPRRRAAALKIVEAAIADNDPQRREAGIRALCNWPDASVAPKLLDLAQTATTPTSAAGAAGVDSRGRPARQATGRREARSAQEGHGAWPPATRSGTWC